MSDQDHKRIFSKNLKKYMDLYGKNQIDLMHDLGISSSTVSSWCTGTKMPRMGKIQMLADYFHIKNTDLMADDEGLLPEGATPYNPTHRIPVLGKISAGLPLYCEQNIDGYTYTDLNGGAEYFALRVTGDSMNAVNICDGYRIIVRVQDIVENGQVAVVRVGDDEATVKRFYRTADTITLMPQSTNPVHQPQIYNLHDTRISIIGLVVKVEFML